MDGQKTTRSWWRHRRRGTALPEFALSIPLLTLIIVGTFFFGWAMKNQQRVKISDRYTAWRNVRAGGVTTGQLNDLFYDEKGVGISITADRGSAGTFETIHDYVEWSETVGGDAGFLADELVRRRFPRGWRVRVAAEFPPEVDAYRYFTGAIHTHHGREGVEWRRGQAWCDDVMAGEYLSTLDEMLNGVSGPGRGMGQAFRQLFLVRW